MQRLLFAESNMEEHERIAINNTKAHLAALKGELAVVNDSLTQALQDKSAAEARLSETKSEIEKARNDLVAVLKRGEELELGFLSREDNISQGTKSLDDERARFETHRITELNAIDDRKKKLDSDIKSKEERVTTLTTLLKDLDGKVANAQEALSDLSAKISEKNKKHNEITEQISKVAARLATDEEKAKKQLDSAKEKLAELKKQIKEEQAKVGVAFINLKNREEEVARKELNLTILKTRFTHRWNKLYPGQPVNID